MTARFARPAAALLLAALLGACQLTQPPLARPTVQAPRPAAVATVAAGDTVYRIAKRHNVSLRAVIDANRLVPPYRLLVGQALTIPVVNEYVVTAGDTLLGISQRFGTTVPDLARLNQLAAPGYVIRVGQRLTLPPAARPAAMPPETLSAKAERRPPPVQAQPVADDGDPFTRILMAITSPRAADDPPAQQQQQQQHQADSPPPPQPQQQAAVQVPVPAEKPEIAKPEAGRPETASPAESPRAKATPSPTPATAMAPLADPPAMKGGFAWPARGKLLARFGSLGKGQHNDGINIDVPRGAPVRAAADGVVAYAGNELRGFGSLLLIKHANGWTTAYAHCDELVVRRGDTVKRGQVVAKAGASGNVRAPQLHFELRKNSDAVDPLQHLPEYKASASTGAAG